MGAYACGGENLAVGKKGMFYTLLSVILIFIFILFIKSNAQTKLNEKSDLVKVRIDTMNNFMESVEQDLQRYVYIAGFRSILSFNQYLLTANSSFEDVQLAFQESIFNGTVNNQAELLLTGSSFSDWSSSIQEKANSVNIDLKFNNPEIYVYQTDPWHVKIDMNVTILASDLAGFASWNYRTKVTSTISILGFDDPLYIIKTQGRLVNIINATIYEGNYTHQLSEDDWDVANLRDHVSKMYYTENSDAPDFLMRFEGKLTSSPYGIESMINLDSLSSRGLPIYEYSVIDHKYWSSSSGRHIPSMQSWFSIDSAHEDKYQVNSIG